jgi:branched-chain amino acid transport system substrate-binding protein
MKRKSSLNTPIVAFLILSLVIALPLIADCKTGAKEPILVGVPVPLTGPFAPIGVDSQKGVELAVEKINDAGGLLGRPLKIVLFDTKDFAPERLMAAADKLVGQDKVDAVHAGWSGWGQDVQAFGKYDVPYFEHNESGSCAKIIMSDLKKYSNVWQLGDIEKKHAADSFNVVSSLPYKYPNKTLAIINTDDAWGSEVGIGVTEAAKKKGWKIVMHETIPYGTREYGPILIKMRSLNPALIHYEDASPPDAITFFRQFMKQPSNSIVNLGYSILPPGFMEEMGKEANGLLGFEMTSVYSPVGPTPESKAWVKEFSEKKEREPSHSSSASYTGIMIWAEAVKAVGDVKNYRAINEYIANNSFNSLIGRKIKFNKGHILTIDEWPNSHLQVQNGVRKTIYTKPGVQYLDYKFQTPPWLKK